jgi:uncharacterized protein
MANARIGQFVWYELLTNDGAAAMAFYQHVLGWKTQPFQDDYTMWVGSQGPLGGVMKLPPGSPVPHWIGNVMVADADATVAHAVKLGGKVHVEPRDIPQVGRYAVLSDPQGAGIPIIAPSTPMTAHDQTKHGEFVWNELLTTDNEAAFGFYSELFGWKRISDFDMGAMGKYIIYGLDESTPLGGMMTKPKDAPFPATFFFYVHVDDLEAAIARATEKGANVQNGPMPVPDGSRIAQLTDPQGAWFALHETPKGK